MKGSDFIFDCITILYYKCHNVSLKHGWSCINFSDWTKTKQNTATNPINDNDKCFQYAATSVLSQKKKKLCNKTNIYPAYISKHKSNCEKKSFFQWFQLELSYDKKTTSVNKTNNIS